MSLDLLAGFDPATVAAIERARVQETQAEGHARAHKSRGRQMVRRAKSEANLAEILPERFEEGDVWDVLSHGDVDALSYLAHAIKATHFDYVAISTWCIARADIEQLAAWLDDGRIDHFELYAGEIFPSQYGDEYEQMLQLCRLYGCRLVIAKNHSKITLACNRAEDYWLSIRSSANVNTNPRIEQTTLSAGRELFEFFRDFLHGLKSIDRASRQG